MAAVELHAIGAAAARYLGSVRGPADGAGGEGSVQGSGQHWPVGETGGCRTSQLHSSAAGPAAGGVAAAPALSSIAIHIEGDAALRDTPMHVQRETWMQDSGAAPGEATRNSGQAGGGQAVATGDGASPPSNTPPHTRPRTPPPLSSNVGYALSDDGSGSDEEDARRAKDLALGYAICAAGDDDGAARIATLAAELCHMGFARLRVVELLKSKPTLTVEQAVEMLVLTAPQLVDTPASTTPLPPGYPPASAAGGAPSSTGL